MSVKPEDAAADRVASIIRSLDVPFAAFDALSQRVLDMKNAIVIQLLMSGMSVEDALKLTGAAFYSAAESAFAYREKLNAETKRPDAG